MRWRRFRKWAKWACTVAAVLALGVAIGSRFYGLTYIRSVDGGAGTEILDLAGGLLHLQHFYYAPEYVDFGNPRGWTVSLVTFWNWGLAMEVPGKNTGWDWQLGVLYSKNGMAWEAGLSLLYPVFVTAMPASLLWHSDRRRRGPHACTKCGYDRRGLATDAPCPECGTRGG